MPSLAQVRLLRPVSCDNFWQLLPVIMSSLSSSTGNECAATELSLRSPAVVLVNKAAPAGQLGAVNGAGQMLASAVRGAAPAICGVIWAASLGLRMPGHQFLPFAIVGAMFIGIFLWYFRQRAVVAQLLAK